MDDIQHIYICGHRNPDVDSVTAAYALADLHHRQGNTRAEPICAGLLPDRAAWVFEHFHLPPPKVRSDVYVRVSDLLRPNTSLPTVSASATLHSALRQLNDSGQPALPVTENDGTFVGMLNPVELLSQFLALSGAGKQLSLAGRAVHSSEETIATLLKAEVLAGHNSSDLRFFDAFVAAASLDSFAHRMENSRLSGSGNVLVIVGDRPEIHEWVVKNQIPLLIVTGDAPVDHSVLRLARDSYTSILRTSYDSGKVIRLLKFATPVGYSPLEKDGITLSPHDRVHDIRSSILHSPNNLFPVLDSSRKLLGVVPKSAFTALPPVRMILVDHNETEQGIPGLDEVPVIEVVDHHRISFRTTSDPIKYTADVVGSTCTIVTKMFRASGLRPSKQIAGVLLAGIVSDTLLFQSPTTTDTDRSIADWLEKICGETPEQIMQGLLSVVSALSSMSPDQAIDSDRKTYRDSGFAFSLCQLEESNLALFHHNLDQIEQALDRVLASEKLDFIGLLVTDPVRGNSEFVFRGSPSVRHALPYRRTDSGLFLLPGILSRKKQLLPQILATLSSL